MNNLILEVNGYSRYGDILTAHGLVKDEHLRVVGETKFPTMKELLADVRKSCTRYEADCVAKKVTQEAEPRTTKKERVRSY